MRMSQSFHFILCYFKLHHLPRQEVEQQARVHGGGNNYDYNDDNYCYVLLR
jgi:hypothetical protein